MEVYAGTGAVRSTGSGISPSFCRRPAVCHTIVRRSIARARVSKPVIFFQGDEDAVVPPNQTEAMVDALRRNGNAVGYFLFAGEQHGFRKAGNIQRSLDAELYFYAIEVFRTGLTF